MSSAYKCDRCMEYFEAYDGNLNPMKDHTYDYIVEIRCKGRYSRERDKCLDLCPKCYKEITDVIFNPRERKNEKRNAK